MIEYSKSVFVHLLFGILVLSLGANSVLAQGNQSSQQQSKAMPPPGVIQPMSNETTEGFGNVTEVQNLTALNQQALENQSAAAQQQGNQSSNQTSNQSAASGGGGAQQQQGNQSKGPIEQIGQAINKMFGGK
ncbi:MAG TPA: hypothetical protein VFH04_04510 [Nitrososphaeraceae archaeon]|nr:hypothetical protein [Nitrososphaeraceae archaeon]